MQKISVKCPAKTTSALDEQSESLEICRPALDAGSHGLQVNCPAKINLTLEVLDKRKDGFHSIQSVMQTIDLYDILTLTIEPSEKLEIQLSGTSDEIPYNEKNLVHKAAMLFFEETGNRKQGTEDTERKPLDSHRISINIEKNIPIAAGLAGGSTDAAGTLWGLNELFNNILSREELHELCAKLGSDLNFCLEGGCQLATSRGEILERLPFVDFDLALIKPKNLGISAKEAYTKFSALENKPNLNMTTKLVDALNSGKTDVENYLHNDLELAVFNDYKELQEIKKAYPKSIMSGSGSTYFILDETNVTAMSEVFWTKTGLKSISHGVSIHTR